MRKIVLKLNVKPWPKEDGCRQQLTRILDGKTVEGVGLLIFTEVDVNHKKCEPVRLLPP